MTPFVVLFQGRSGSTLLIEYLNSHPEILAIDEAIVGFEGEARRQEQLDWVREYLTVDSDPPKPCKGFKTKLEDILDPDGFSELLSSLDARLLFLHRRNRIKLVTSLINGRRLFEQTGRWNRYGRGGQAEAVEIPVALFHKGLSSLEEEAASLRSYVEGLALPTLELTYEGLSFRAAETLSDVCRFLGVEPCSLSTKTRKNTPNDLRAALRNFDELKKSFRGSRYAMMFDEGANRG